MSSSDGSSDPGAARFGNFINYYQFNPTQKRLCHLPKNLLQQLLPQSGNLDDPILCLDIGCNSGDLTFSLRDHFAFESGRPLKILGVDLDKDLVDCAKEKQAQSVDVTFRHLDLTDPSSESVLSEHLSTFGKKKFDVVFCFSVTMWVHLNHGDDGLVDFLRRLSKFGKYLVLEPQPWKCYRTASRRMRKLNQPDFEKIEELRFQGAEVLKFIDRTCVENGFERVSELGETHWSRPIWVYSSK